MATLIQPVQGKTSNQALKVAFEHHKAQRYPQARAIYEQILQYDPSNAHALHLLGVLEFHVGRYMRAVEFMERAIAVRGNIADFHTNLGEAWRALDAYEKAIACHQRAIELEPTNADIRVNLASALTEASLVPAAREQYAAAYQLLEGDTKALVALCDKLERLNQPVGARVIVDAPKARYPAEPGLTLIDAALNRREGNAELGIVKLEPLQSQAYDPLLEIRVAFELGRLYDRVGRYGQAYASFEAANSLREQVSLTPEIKPEMALASLTGMSEILTPEWLASWQPVMPSFERRAPVFLVGFPRSGTTLLEQITSSHSQICSAEERPLIEMLKSILDSCGMRYPDVIASLKEADIHALRAAYFEAADVVTGMSPGKILLDKLPLHIIDMPFIHRVFPDAKFIFMLRHPMDSILSCFMQDFQLNGAMANFLHLEDAAKFYDTVMRLWRQSVELMPVNYHIARYENLVANFNGETQRLLDFLGLPWEESLLDYQKKARSRKMINTPSYNQVSEPIYSRAVYRWQRYEVFLAPILPIIDPWVEYFGYKE